MEYTETAMLPSLGFDSQAHINVEASIQSTAVLPLSPPGAVEQEFEVNQKVGVIGLDGDFRVAQLYMYESFLLLKNNYEKGVRIPRPWFNPSRPQLIQIGRGLYFFDDSGAVFSEDEKGMVWHHCEYRIVEKAKTFSLRSERLQILERD